MSCTCSVLIGHFAYSNYPENRIYVGGVRRCGPRSNYVLCSFDDKLQRRLGDNVAERVWSFCSCDA